MQILGVRISNLAILDDSYDQFSFNKNETTSGFNIIYNMFLPNLYMLIINEFFLGFKFSHYMYYIVIGYLLIRYLVIGLFLGRIRLLNVKYELTLVFLTLTVTYIAFSQFISKNISFFIPIEEFRNELFLLIILFLYSIFKNRIMNYFNSRENTSNRKKYIIYQFNKFYKKYNKHIQYEFEFIVSQKNINNYIVKNKKKLITILYSIMIYENYSRPKLFRFIENILYKNSTKIHSTGIMQTQNYRINNDFESITIATRKIIDYSLKQNNDDSSLNRTQILQIVNNYNISDDFEYGHEVLYIYSILEQETENNVYFEIESKLYSILVDLNEKQKQKFEEELGAFLKEWNKDTDGF